MNEDIIVGFRKEVKTGSADAAQRDRMLLSECRVNRNDSSRKEREIHMSIRIVTDSASDITREELTQYGIELVAIPMVCGGVSCLDDKTVPMERFWQQMEQGETIKTSLPSPDQFLQIFEAAKEAGDEVICVLISSGLSGTCQSANVAKSMAEYENIWIVDSLSAAAAQKLLVFRACELRDQGMSAAEIAEDLETFRSRIRLYACLDTLMYLARGGRLPGSIAAIGTKLQFKPVITFDEEGKIRVEKTPRGAKQAMKEMLRLAKERPVTGESRAIPLFASKDENCRGYIAALEESGFSISMKEMEGIGATIGTYIGPGAYGIAIIS